MLEYIMGFNDFVIPYNPKEDSGDVLAKRVLKSLVLNRLRWRKPAVWLICGGSGEGKSLGALRIQELLAELQGYSLKECLNDCNVYIPVEYPKKLKPLLFDKRLKKVNFICMHEARDIIRAKMWHTFVAQAISDVNAQSRSIKRMCIMIVSQFIKDITSEVRYTVNYYAKVSRPMGRKTRMYLQVMWHDDRDPEKPKLRKRRLRGLLKYPNGRYRKFFPKYLELTLPDKEVVAEFEKNDTEAKAKILKAKLDKLVKEMSKEVGIEGVKVSSMIDWYAKHPDSLSLIGKFWGGKWRVKPQAKEMHELSGDELKQFQDGLNNKLRDMGLIKSEATN